MLIKQMREKLNMSQKELADKVGVDRTSIAKWESGAAIPGALKLPKIAEVLGCSIDELFDRQEVNDA